MQYYEIMSNLLGPPRPQGAIKDFEEGCNPVTCYDSFKEHWQQTCVIIQRNQQLPSHDDVRRVIKHLERMVSLLLYDIRNTTQISSNLALPDCLEFVFEENLLDRLWDWSLGTGKYINVVRLEQLKLFETLISHRQHVVLVWDPFLRPLLRLLESCQDDVLPNDSQKCLVALLYQLCMLLKENVDLVDLFIKNDPKPRFIILKLLKPFVNREDSIGTQARDTLLICMLLSKKKLNVAEFILRESNICILLVFGLRRLYSILPRALPDVTAPDFHRLTPHYIRDVKGLSSFVTSLTFTNAVTEVAHSCISRKLEEFVLTQFLIPVLDQALRTSNIGEQITATAYLELILRTVSQPGLLYPLLQFLIQTDYGGKQLLTILIERMNSEPQLMLVSLALFESLIEVNCEDIMLELVFQYLRPCLHVIQSQRCTTYPIDIQCQNSKKFLTLTPNCCDTNWNHYGNRQILFGNYHAYLCDARNKINLCQAACSMWNNGYTGCETIPLVSLGESSGYESLQQNMGKDKEGGVNIPVWQMSSKEVNRKEETNNLLYDPNCVIASEAIGPFLIVILNKLKVLLGNSIDVNLHLTGLISRLAVYPQPLLRGYLLDHSLALQPNVPSLFQVITSLKNEIDSYMSRQADKSALIEEARSFLVDRVRMPTNTTVERTNSFSAGNVATNESKQPFQQNRRQSSFRQSLSSISNKFNRRPSQIETNIPLIPRQENIENTVYPIFGKSQHVAICAVILDEWVKELAALAQEHTISQLHT